MGPGATKQQTNPGKASIDITSLRKQISAMKSVGDPVNL